MSLSFYDRTGQAETVVCKGVMPDGLTFTVWRQDGTRLNVHNAHLCLKMQADLTNIPHTPLDYCKEVGKGISKEEAEALACPRILSPVQQELMDWHHHLYHVSFPKMFRLAEKGICQRVYSNARVHYPFALCASLGLHIDVLGARAVRPLGLFVVRIIYFRVMEYPSIGSRLPNQDSYPRCLASLLVAAFGIVLL